MESCEIVNIQVESDEGIFNPVVCGIGSVIGIILGFILGFFLIKFCFLQSVKKFASFIFMNKSKDTRRESENVEDKPMSTTVAFEKKRKSSLSSRIRNDSFSSEISHKVKENEDVPEDSFLETIKANSVDNMLDKHHTVVLIKLQKLKMQSWKNRHKTILQVFKLITNSYMESENINEKEQEFLVKSADEALSKVYKTPPNIIEKNTEEENESRYRFKESSFYSDHEKFLVYKKAIDKFEIDLLELVGFKDAPLIREVLVKSFKNIEENIEVNQNHTLKVLIDSFSRDVIVLQAYHSENLLFKDIMRKCRRYFQVMIERLIDSDRLSEDESDALWRQIKEQVEQQYDNISEDFEKSLQKLTSKCEVERRKVMSLLTKSRENSIEQYHLDDSSMSTSRRINEYFKLISELDEQEFTANQDLTKREIYQINELQKSSKLKLLSTYENIQEEFCESLCRSDAISNQDAQIVLNELIKKNKRAIDDISTINEIQTKIIQREIKSLQSFRRKNNEDESDIKTVSKEIMKEQEITDVKRFLASQPYLNDEDRDVILHEWNVLKLLLSNNQLIADVTECFRSDVELLRLQFDTVMIERREENLSSDEDVDQLVKNLEKQRKKFKKESLDSNKGEQGVKNYLQIILCKSTAESIINNLLPEIKTFQQHQKLLQKVKEKLLATVLNNDVKDEVVEEIDKMHKREVNSIQTSLREDFNTEAQTLKDRLSYQHTVKLQQVRAQVDDRPLSASSLSSADLLQRLLDQDKNKRLAETIESNLESLIMLQIYMLRLKYEDKLQETLQTLDKKLLCNVAKVSGLRRNDLIQCINAALVLETDKDKKQVGADIMKYWTNPNSFQSTANTGSYEDRSYDIKSNKKSKRKIKKLK